jgi:acyl carrier protein
MEKTEAFERVVKIIGPFAKNTVALKSAREETRILEDLGVNSARLVDIILAFEDNFGISVDDEAADQIRTLGDAANLIVQKVGHA